MSSPTPRRAEVARLLAAGLSRAEVARRLGVTRPTITYHARMLGLPPDVRGSRRYDWAAVQSYYDEGHSVRQCCTHFGFSAWSWNEAVKRGAVVARPAETPLEKLLVDGMRRHRGALKRRLLQAGLKEPACERCGIDEWNGEPLSLALHHRNGDGRDNRLENLELLCPNCHSQTENFAGRNRGREDAERTRSGDRAGPFKAAEGRSGDRGPNRPSACWKPTPLRHG